MADLERSLEQLGQSLGADEGLEAWLRALPLPQVLPWFTEELELFSREDLDEVQEGYTGPQWNPNWTVFASASGDAVIADTASAGTPVLYAVHGLGSWHPELLAPSLAVFARALAIWVRVVGKDDAGNDGALRPDVLQAVQTEIAPLVGSQATPLWLGKHWLSR